jgi:hypothetical protein
MSIQISNFEHLSDLYFRETRAYKAADFLKDSRIKERGEEILQFIFLENWTKVSKENIQEARIVREHFVFLMKYYSLLEICCLSGFISDPSDSDFWSDTKKNLNLPAVKRFYETEYPLLLTEFLAKRLNRDLSLKEEKLDGLSPILLTFLGTIDRMQRNADISIFLCPLFYSEFCDYGYHRLFELFMDRESCAEQFLNPPTAPDHSHRLVRGFDDFLIFCEDLDRLLSESDSYPLLQSAMWNYYADIFQNRAHQLKSTVTSLVDVLESPAESFKVYSKNIHELLERLTSGLYGRYISKAVMEGSRVYR